jgi:hypothetical protein
VSRKTCTTKGKHTTLIYTTNWLFPKTYIYIANPHQPVRERKKGKASKRFIQTLDRERNLPLSDREVEACNSICGFYLTQDISCEDHCECVFLARPGDQSAGRRKGNSVFLLQTEYATEQE